MADVFLSYKREDAAKARKLVEALRGQGLDTWWDEDIPGGAPWEPTIEKSLAQAKAVVVCWSPHAVASENVRSEARVGREDGRLVQVLLRPCQPPLFFGERQAFDLSKWRGSPDDARVARLVDCVRKVAAGDRVESGEQLKRRKRFNRRVASAAAMLLIFVLAGAGWWMLRPVEKTGPQTLAVLPFRALKAGDANLVDAIWDDTRGAISRNPNLRVIGRQAVEALAADKVEPADYRRKLGADYLLDGSVEHVGDRVQMKLSLVRTADSAEVWSDRIGGKLDDVFAFQQRVANEVEGRIRGRVAPGGGVSAKNIATSGEVYAIYADARAKIRTRGPQSRQAIPLLKKAVAMDPNYAPAWAALGQAIKMRGEGTLEQVDREANADVARALTLAPNLAHAYAVRALIYGTRAETEPDLRKAVALDPNDVEAWMWLGNCLSTQHRIREALKAHSRAVEIEPLWFTSMLNKMDDFARLGDRPGLAGELRRAEATGDAYLTLRAREHVAYLTGQIAARARNEFEIRRRFRDQARISDAVEILMLLGRFDDIPPLFGMPVAEAAPYRGIPLPAQELRKRYQDPVDFWKDGDGPNLYARLLRKQGRLAEYAGYYKSAFRNADDYYSTIAWADWEQFADQAPSAAANLRAAGEPALAQQIIDKDDAIIAPLLRNGTPHWDVAWRVAQLRAVEGRDDEAIVLLRRAIDEGWLPDGDIFAFDIADEPSFSGLLNRADFQAVRHRVLTHIESERRQITPDMLRSAGLG